MLEPKLILKGPICNYDIPKNWLMGKYIIECQKKRNPENVLYVDGYTNQTLTSGMLVDKALKLANALIKMGVQKGDMVCIITENNINYMVIVVAVLYIGAIINPLNPGYSTGELLHAFSMVKPKVLFCSKMALNSIIKLKDEVDLISQIILTEEVPEVSNIDTLEHHLTAEKNCGKVEPAVFDSEEHTAIIFLSSGTTGLPKAVQLTHANFYYTHGCVGHPDYCALQSDDVAIGFLPFFHILGFTPVLAAAVYSVKLVVLPVFQPEVFLRCVKTYNVTVTYAVPPVMSFFAKHPIVDKFDISSLRLIPCAGGSLGKEIQEEFTARLPHIKILLAYGITETTGLCTLTIEKNAKKTGYVGQVAPYLEAMVWVADLGKNVGPLQTGELCFRGPSIMKGYSGKENNDIDEYGFYHTGDTGYYNEDGGFYIVGRIKELIKYKGFQVPPAELEDLLLKHPAVKECGVFGIPDERTGQLPAAFVVCQSNANVTEDDLVNYVADRISVQKHLHGGVKFTDTIPRNPAGKILRNKLLELYNKLSTEQ